MRDATQAAIFKAREFKAAVPDGMHFVAGEALTELRGGWHLVVGAGVVEGGWVVFGDFDANEVVDCEKGINIRGPR